VCAEETKSACWYKKEEMRQVLACCDKWQEKMTMRNEGSGMQGELMTKALDMIQSRSYTSTVR
jgi:hypothetical protein